MKTIIKVSSCSCYYTAQTFHVHQFTSQMIPLRSLIYQSCLQEVNTVKLLVPSRPRQSSEEPMSSRLSERIKKPHYGSVGLLQFHTTIYKHIPIWSLISKKVGMLSSGQTMAEKKKKTYSDHSDRSLKERCCFPASRKANTEPKVKRKEKL